MGMHVEMRSYQERKRTLLRDAMKVVLRPLTRLEKTGVRMQLPAKDGTWHTRTVLMTPALASYDNPEKNKVTGAKDGYRISGCSAACTGAQC